MSQNQMGEFTQSVLSSLKNIVDVNTIIGNPISTAGGVVIIPVSKVSFGYGAGGSDLPVDKPGMFGAGSGGGVTIEPIAFLIIKGTDVQLMQMQTADNTNDRIVNAIPGIMDKLIELIPKKDKKDEEV